MIEIKVRGEVVKRVFNEKIGDGDYTYSKDYIVLKLPPREIKKGKIVSDHIPIEVYSSRTSAPHVQNVKVGYEIEVNLFVECILWTPEIIINSYKYDNGYTQKSPKLFPKFTINGDDGLVILKSDDREGRDETNRSFENGIALNPQDPEDDLPF